MNKAIGTACVYLTLCAGSARAAVTLDQSSTAGDGHLRPAINGGSEFVVQTYTAGLTGMVAGVSVDVIETANFNLPLEVQIRTVVGGLPSTTILGETSTTAFSLNDVIAFPQTIPQVAGIEYAIAVDFLGAPPPPPGGSIGAWVAAHGDPYPAGRQLWINFDGTFLLGDPDVDVNFKTYVSTSVPEPSSLTGAITGLLGLGVLGRLWRSKRSVTPRRPWAAIPWISSMPPICRRGFGRD